MRFSPNFGFFSQQKEVSNEKKTRNHWDKLSQCDVNDMARWDKLWDKIWDKTRRQGVQVDRVERVERVEQVERAEREGEHITVYSIGYRDGEYGDSECWRLQL